LDGDKPTRPFAADMEPQIHPGAEQGALLMEANAILIVDLRVASGPVRKFLLGKGIVTREKGEFRGGGQYLRVTVGRPRHSDHSIAELSAGKKAAC
jgi:histidinol-phosphate/aromatic aminotransferase/cobyric acid decarboxylase-like protein